MNRSSQIYLITGASGAGKTTLINALYECDYPIIEESGRIIVENELGISGTALPWKDGLAFGEKIIDHTLASLYENSKSPHPTFSDRGLIDNLAWYAGLGQPPPEKLLRAVETKPYCEPIFILPPWKEIYIQDEVRNKGFDQALIEYDYIITELAKLDLKTVKVPQVPINERVKFIQEHIL